MSNTTHSRRVLRADPLHRRQRNARVRPELPDRAARRRRGVRRVDRDGEHVRDGRRRAHPPHRAAAAHRRVGAVAAGRDRPAGARRRRDRRVPRARRRHGARRGRGRGSRDGCWASATSPYDLVRADLLLPAVDRRAHDLGGRVGGIAPRADGDAAAGARRLGRGVARRGRAPHRPQRRGARPVHRRAARCCAGGHRAGLVTPLGRRRRVRRRHPVVHRARARRDPGDAAGAAAGRPAVRALGDRRASPPRTRCATPSAPAAWRSAS